MNLKEFNLERAIAGDPVVTRDGRKVTQLHRFDCPDDKFQVYGVVDNAAVESFTDAGTCYAGGVPESYLDLFMLPKTIVVWTNYYEQHPDDPTEYTIASAYLQYRTTKLMLRQADKLINREVKR